MNPHSDPDAKQKNIVLVPQGNLRRYLNQSEDVEISIDVDESLQQIYERLGIPFTDIFVSVVDNEHRGLDYIPKHADRIEIWPALTGG